MQFNKNGERLLDQASSCQQHERVAVILAGGEGSRLRSLTRKIAGQDIPKQFCPIFGIETLVEQTLRRVALVIEPRLTSVVVTRTHKPVLRSPAAFWPDRDERIGLRRLGPGKKATRAETIFHRIMSSFPVQPWIISRSRFPNSKSSQLLISLVGKLSNASLRFSCGTYFAPVA